MLTIVVRFSLTALGGITILSIGPSPTGSACITWAFMDLASSLVLSGIGGSASGTLLLGGGARLLTGLGGETGGDGVGARLAAILCLPNLQKCVKKMSEYFREKEAFEKCIKYILKYILNL